MVYAFTKLHDRRIPNVGVGVRVGVGPVEFLLLTEYYRTLYRFYVERAGGRQLRVDLTTEIAIRIDAVFGRRGAVGGISLSSNS